MTDIAAAAARLARGGKRLDARRISTGATPRRAPPTAGWCYGNYAGRDPCPPSDIIRAIAARPYSRQPSARLAPDASRSRGKSEHVGRCWPGCGT